MPTSAELTLSDLQFDKIRSIIYDNTGISIGDGRTSLLLSRLRSRLRELDEPDFKSYIARVTSDKSELQELINRITTNKTYFFRTPRIWEHFSEVAIEAFHARGTMRPMRVWSAASSTGEEPYTLAITLDELARSARIRPNVRILATDISTRVLERARAGVYLEKSADQVPPDVRDRCFERDAENGTLSVRQHIKDYVLYRRLNLSKPPFPMRGPLDTVFCRNVMFYFNEQVKENLVTEIAKLLKVDGLFMLGMAESLAGNDKRFRRIGPSAYARTQEPA